MRREFIEACYPGIISPNGSTPVHHHWLEPARRQRPSTLLSSESHPDGPGGQTHQPVFPAVRAGWGPKQRSWATKSRGSGAHLEVPDVIHLPAEVEVELRNQQPVPVSGEPRRAATVRGCHVARAIKVAKVLVSFERTKGNTMSFVGNTVGSAERQGHGGTPRAKGSHPAPSVCQMLQPQGHTSLLRPEGPDNRCKSHPHTLTSASGNISKGHPCRGPSFCSHSPRESNGSAGLPV